MDYKRGENGIVLRLDEGEEAVQSILLLCKKESIRSASISGIGAVRKAVLAHFDSKEMKYHSELYEGMYEVVSLTGNIAMLGDEPILHAHMVIADTSYKCFGGHLNNAVVNPTLEILITPLDAEIKREKDEKTGLNLQRF
jgi:predicted DNA-binding protein with PD1-like motif